MTMRNEDHLLGDDAGERGIPGTTTRKKSRVKTLLFALLIVISIIASTGFAIVAINRFTAQKLKDHAEAKRLAAEHAATPENAKDLSSLQQRVKADEIAAASAAAARAAAADSVPAPANATQRGGVATAGATRRGQDANDTPSAPVQTPAEIQAQQVADRRLGGGVTISDSESDSKASHAGDGGPVDSAKSSIAALAAAMHAPSASLPTTALATKKNALEEQLTPSTMAVGEASLLPDLDYLLERGTNIPCGVVTRVVTTYPGAVRCTILRDVYSAYGHTILIRAGAQANGEQRNALLQGQAKIFVLWDTIDDGKVEITVNSPAADSLGGSGMDAYVDNHYLQRFSGSVLVSVIGDFGQAVANKTVGGGTSQVSFSNSSNATQSAADDILKSTIDIPPTGYSNQGALTNIFVARHIDMRSVYELKKDE